MRRDIFPTQPLQKLRKCYQNTGSRAPAQVDCVTFFMMGSQPGPLINPGGNSGLQIHYWQEQVCDLLGPPAPYEEFQWAEYSFPSLSFLIC